MNKEMRFEMYDNKIESVFAELRATTINEFMEHSKVLEQAVKNMVRRAYEDGSGENK